MANEIKQTLNITIEKDGFVFRHQPAQISADLTGDSGGNPGAVSVGNSAEETIDFGDVSPGLVIMYNLDSTNFVAWGICESGDASAKKGGKLLPQGPHEVIYLDGTMQLRMQADTGACKVMVLGFDP